MAQQGSVQRPFIGNRLLAALPTKDYERLRPAMEEVSLRFNSTIYAHGDTIRHVYFPVSGVVSLLTAIDDHSTVDVGMIGSEGMIGMSLFLGVATSLGRTIVQGSGSALRMKASDFVDECRKGDALPDALRRYTCSVLAQIAQSAACLRFHPIKERLARRLLMLSDRMEASEVQMTQDVLSKMLGVRREAVTYAAGALQKAKLTSNSRCNIKILDRPALEAAACKCYNVIREVEKSYSRAR